MSKKIQIVEVGLRDGLQNEKILVRLETRSELLEKLSQAGARRLEIGAFVRSDKIPQMAGSKEVIEKAIEARKNKKISSSTQFSALVPNLKGLEEAISTGIEEIAIFASASESFSKANINCSIEESFERFLPVVKLAKSKKIKIRGYLSVCFGCPYEGEVSPRAVVSLAKKLYQMGCYEISIGDTIGVASPLQVKKIFSLLKKQIPIKKIAGHFHDTRGTSLANICAAIDQGVRVFDTSLGGLGGCPYAPGSAGNVATEDVVYMLEKMGYKTGIDLNQYIQINHWMSEKMGKKLPAKLSKAGDWPKKKIK